MASSTSDMQRVGIFLPKQLMAKIKTHAKTKGIRQSEMIRRILDDYFQDHLTDTGN